jgi:hypothetical protein
MADLTYDIQVNKDQAQRNLDNLQTSVGRLNDAFGLLRTAIATIGLGSIISQANQFADTISDLSDATGISIDNILGFSSAVAQSGGNAETAERAILRLVGSIGGAADGSLELQNAFKSVKVSLDDLRTLSEQDILKKTIAGLGQVTDKAEQSRLKTQLLGKELRNVAVEDLADKFGLATDKAAQYVTGIKAGADAQQALETNMKMFQLTILKIIEPLNTFISSIELSSNAFHALVGALGVATAALGVFMIAAAPVTGTLLLIAGAAAALGAAWSKYKDVVKEDTPPPVKTEDVKTTENQGKAIRQVTDALEKRRKEISKASDAFKRQNNDIIDNINLEKSFIGKSEEYIEVEKAREAVFKRAGEESLKLRDAKAMLSKEEAGLAAVYDAQIAKIVAASGVDAERIAKSTEGLIGLRAVEKARKQDIENTNKAIEDQIARNQSLGESLRGINDQRVSLTFETGQIGKGALEKQFANIQENSRKAVLEAGRTYAAAFEDTGDGMTPEKAQEFADGLAKISEGYQGIAAAQTANLEASLTWEAGWQEAFANYAENANNAASEAKTYFDTFTGGMENALVKFAQTGKLSFKDLANSIIADLIRIQTKKALVSLFSGGGIFGSLFGFAAGGATDTSPMIVGERGPELFVPGSAGRIIPNNQLGNQEPQQMLTTVNYNIQAVDASSFRQLVARDPQFIYSVTEKGRRGVPTRR